MRWLNWQNKKHFALYSNEDDLNKRAVNITWMSSLFQRQQEHLNKRVTQISPRRGKKITAELFDKIFSEEGATLEELEEFHEILEDDIT